VQAGPPLVSSGAVGGEPRARQKALSGMVPDSDPGSAADSGVQWTLRNAVQATDSYALLLTLLVVSYGFTASGLDGRFTTLMLAFFASVTVLLAFHTSRVPRGFGLHRVVAVLAVAVAASGIVAAVSGSDGAHGVASFAAAFLLALSVCAVTWRIMIVSTTRVTLETILGAIAVYLMLAFVFAATYLGIQVAGGRGFFVTGLGERGEVIYYSLVTLTTIGYGDFTAATSLGRSLSAFEGFLGQIFLAVLLARLVALYRGPRRDEAG